MKNKILLIFLFIEIFSASLLAQNDKIIAIKKQIKTGNFIQATAQIQDLLCRSDIDFQTRQALLYELELMNRINIEFSLTEKDVRKRLSDLFPNVSENQLKAWQQSGKLEMRIIDNQKKYFNRAVGNLFLLDSVAKAAKVAKYGKSKDNVSSFCERYIPELITKKQSNGTPFDHKKIKIAYSVTLPANTLPANETVRCWLPFPHEDGKFVKISNLKIPDSTYIVTDKKDFHTSIYFEKQTVANETLTFSYTCEVELAANYFQIDETQIKPYNKNSDIYKTFTQEQLPHIVFNQEVSSLAQSIVGTETNPYRQVKKLYYWLDEHIPWAGALEYSVFDCIPTYVLQNARGDCGMQTFLFLSMARSLGIPCKWQSGWYLLPEEVNMHDWAEVYYEGIGWVPLDASFKLIENENLTVKEFYITGIDPYRLIVNNGTALPFFPAKLFFRSEPHDFQRGELEWRGGNLYFDKWDYEMEVDYLN